MGSTKNQGKSAMKVAIYILLITWIILLLLLAAIYMLRLKGYNSFKEWQNRNNVQEVMKPGIVNPSPTEIIVPTVTPAQTATPEPTLTPTPTMSPTPTVTPTPEPTPTPTEVPPYVRTIEFSGNAVVDAQLRWQAEKIFGIEEEPCFVSYANGIWFSTVFQKGDIIYPVVYNLDTAEQVQGSDLIKDTYFAIIKERLQTYMAETYPTETEDEFLTYKQVYQAEDYQKFYLTETHLVFCFDANTLTSDHPAFSYAVELSEAQAFFKYNLDGTKAGIAIRELDPDKPMVAFTFDDGPHFEKKFSMNNLDIQLVNLFNRYNGKATFFFVGDRISGAYESGYGKIARTVYEAGFEVASHTFSHDMETVKFYSSAASQKPLVWKEFNSTNLAIAKVTGHAPDYIRLPGGSDGKWTKEMPLPIINWNVDSIDYKEKNKENGAEIIYERMKETDIKDGSIILLHSIYQTTYDAVELLLPYLEAQGYQFVTLSELFYYKGIELKDGVTVNSAVKKETQESAQ